MCRFCHQQLRADPTADVTVGPDGSPICPAPVGDSAFDVQYRACGIDPLALAAHDSVCGCARSKMHAPFVAERQEVAP